MAVANLGRNVFVFPKKTYSCLTYNFSVKLTPPKAAISSSSTTNKAAASEDSKQSSSGGKLIRLGN